MMSLAISFSSADRTARMRYPRPDLIQERGSSRNLSVQKDIVSQLRILSDALDMAAAS
jgi:hypothetical protein